MSPLPRPSRLVRASGRARAWARRSASKLLAACVGGALLSRAAAASGEPSRRFLAQAPPKWPLPRGLDALEGISYPSEWPWSELDFRRQDEADDAGFYSSPRLVKHIDENAIAGITGWYRDNLPTGDAAVLDVCSSWISHFPDGMDVKRAVGIGMSLQELQQNKQLTEVVQQDLNKNPTLPFADRSFDAIVNAVSVDYLNKPFAIFQEFLRVSRPGALVAMSFSNRMFFTKAIKRWTEASEYQRLLICASYFHFAGFVGVRAERIDAGRGDPMYVVYGRAPPGSAAAAARSTGPSAGSSEL